jgi:hypothetical protein
LAAYDRLVNGRWCRLSFNSKVMRSIVMSSYVDIRPQ